MKGLFGKVKVAKEGSEDFNKWLKERQAYSINEVMSEKEKKDKEEESDKKLAANNLNVNDAAQVTKEQKIQQTRDLLTNNLKSVIKEITKDINKNVKSVDA